MFRDADKARREAEGPRPRTQRPPTPSTSAAGLHPWWSGGGGGIYECDAAAPATNTRELQDRPRHQLQRQSRLMFSFVNLYTIKFIKASTAFSDGAVGRMRHLGTRPAPCGRAAPQPPTRCEDRLPSTAQKKTGSRGKDEAGFQWPPNSLIGCQN